MKAVRGWAWIWVVVVAAGAGCTQSRPDGDVERRQSALLTPAGAGVHLDLNGGLASLNGVSLTFSNVTDPGETAVIETAGGATPPPDAFYISTLGPAVSIHHWRIATTAHYTGDVHVCIHYDQTEITGPFGELTLALFQDAVDTTSSVDTSNNIICGFTTALSTAPTGTVGGTVTFRGVPVHGVATGDLSVVVEGSASVGVDPATGTFAIPGLLAGTYTVDLLLKSCAGGVTLHSRSAVVDSSGSSPALNLLVNAGAGEVTGRIVGGGVPLANTLVTFDEACRQLRTDGDGVFDAFLAAGPYTARFGASGALGTFPFDTIGGDTLGVGGQPTPAGLGTHVDLLGGVAALGGISIDFEQITTAGFSGAVPVGAVFVDRGLMVVDGGNPVLAGWELSTSAAHVGAVDICVHYADAGAPIPPSVRLVQGGAHGSLVDITTTSDPTTGTICGNATSTLNPRMPAGLTTDVGPNRAPVIGTGPGPIDIFTPSAEGQPVTYPVPTAVDPEEGSLPVVCTPPSGATFPIGTTTVTCHATDGEGAVGTLQFDVNIHIAGTGAAGTGGAPDGGAAGSGGAAPDASFSPLGDPCSDAATCSSGFCVDGVCCDGACGGGVAGDCQGCSMAAGASMNGTCSSLAGQVCATPASICELSGVCASGPACPGTTAIAGCSTAPVPSCSAGACPEIDVPGGAGPGNQISLDVQGGIDLPPGVSSGQVSARPCGDVPPVTDGFKIVLNNTDAACWDIDVSPDVHYTADPDHPIIVCITAPDVVVAGQGPFFLYHDEGGGFIDRTISVDYTTGTVCASVESLSPFAIVTTTDHTPPVISGMPGPMVVAYATSTAGAKVSFPMPTAVDDVDGPVPVSCTRASGSTFAPGPTTVTCKAKDRAGNVSAPSFIVWVKYQAPTDGSFFLQPINADGTSIFKSGTIPVKFKLTGASASIANLTARLYVSKLSSGVTGTDLEATSTSAADVGNVFRYDASARQYIFNLSTKNMATGTWSIRAELGDGVTHQIGVSLK